MQWIEENFPENKEYSTTLLKQLMKEFLDKKRYHDDPRFINYCLKFVSILVGVSREGHTGFPYAGRPRPSRSEGLGSSPCVLIPVHFRFLQAEYNSDRHQFFEFLCNHGIGTRCSRLYIAWAAHLEASGELQLAGAVFQRGLQSRAEPGEPLRQQYR